MLVALAVHTLTQFSQSLFLTKVFFNKTNIFDLMVHPGNLMQHRISSLKYLFPQITHETKNGTISHVS